MTNKEWFEKNNVSFANAMKQYNPDNDGTFEMFLMAERQLRFKVGMIVAGMNESEANWLVNVITAINREEQRYETKFFHANGRWLDSFIPFSRENELECVGVVAPSFAFGKK